MQPNKPTFGVSNNSQDTIINTNNGDLTRSFQAGSETSTKFNTNFSDEVGCLWEKLDKNGRRYLNIKVDKKYLLNKLKESDNDHIYICAFYRKPTKEGMPNFRIFKS